MKQKTINPSANSCTLESEENQIDSHISQMTISNLENSTIHEEAESGRKVIDWLRGLDEDASRRYARKQMAGTSQSIFS